jgi:hypothetical protein
MIKLIIAITLLIIVLILTTIFVIYIFKSLLRPSKTAPYIWSFNRHLLLMKKLNINKWTNLIDLWCWDGKALRFFDKNFNLKILTWYDINPYAIIWGKILNILQLHKNISLQKKNFLKINLKWYDYIYVYLRPSQLANIEGRLRKNKDQNTIIISNSFEFDKHKPFEIIKNTKWKNSIFLYN